MTNPVLEFTAAYKAAVYEKNADHFTSLYSKQVRIFDAWDVWSIESFAVWHKTAEDWFSSLNSERVVVDFEDIRFQLGDQFCSGSAFVTYSAVDATGRKLRALTNRHTWILEKVDAAWKVIHEHSSAPADAETQKVLSKFESSTL